MAIVMVKQNICDCGEIIPWQHDKQKQPMRCESCREKRRKEVRRRNQKDYVRRTKVSEDEYIKPVNWEPKPKPAPIMTDEEQRRIDRKCHLIDIKRTEFSLAPMRLLTREEIEQIEGELTPLHQIQKKHEIFMNSWLF